MKIKFATTFLIISGLIIFGSCKKDDKDPDAGGGGGTAAPTGNVKMHLDSKWGISNDDIVIGNEYIHAMSGDSIMLATYKYYISNFRLKKSDGSWWSQPNSYYLVNHANVGSNVFDLTGVPPGNYTDISFVMGVDSLKNVSGAQAGALSTANDMFWSWSSGYIMIKAEGTSPQVSPGSVFSYHLGGFSGAFNIVQKKEYSFGATPLIVTTTTLPNIHMRLDVEELFDGVGSVSNGSTSSPGPLSLTMATSFYNGILFDYLTN